MKNINLNQREKYAVSVAACFIVLFIVFMWVVYPLLEKRELLSRALEKKSVELREMQTLRKEYHSLQTKADLTQAALAKRDKDFSLFSYLDSLVGEIDIKDNVSRWRPTTSSDNKISTVELKLQAITMEQLSKFLYQVEYSGNNLYVKRMSISETTKTDGYLDVVLQVETIVI